MFRDVVPPVGAGQQRSDCKGVPQGMRGRPSMTSSARQSDFIGDCSKCNVNMVEQQRLAAKRNKYVIVEGGVWASFLQIAFEPRSRTLMYGNQPAFSELGRAD